MLNALDLPSLSPSVGTANSPPPIIRTVALSKTYPDATVAVVSLDLEIGKGEIFALLGPNGAGKTTTIGMLTTRVIPSSGVAQVGGVDIVRHPALAKQVIGVVPQTNTLDRAMTVYENLYFHGRYFGMGSKEARETTNELLVRVRLADRAKTPVIALSGGMAQRLMVARAVMHRPQILFLDEPTAGLDPQSRLAVWEIVKELHGEGETIVLTTHYMEEADVLCDRVAVMDHGRILALDTPEALKRGVGADSIVRVSADGDLRQLADHLRATLPGVTEVRVVDGTVRVLASGAGLLPHIVNAAERVGIDVTDLSVSEPTLETVFLDLTGKDLRMTAATAPVSTAGLARLRPPGVAYRRAFVALLQRDLHVLRKTLVLSSVRTIMQPLLLMFVFTYVFPKIGQGVGGSSSSEAGFTATLVAGVVGLAMVFQGIQAVALPLVQEFGYSKEIEDRVLAPLPTRLVAVQKIATGALQGLLAAAVVFPIAAVVPATDVHLSVHWPVLLTVAPLAAWVAAALGLVLGTRVAPERVTYLFALVVLPLTFLGAIYYPWQALEPIRWLQLVVLVNPLVYMCEGFRAALTHGVAHMSLLSVYAALIGFAIMLTWLGIDGFVKRTTA